MRNYIFNMLICIIIIFACEKSTTNSKIASPTGAVEFQSECKSSLLSESLSKSMFTIPDTQACIHYSYDGEGRLELTHINAGFNCCPGNISSIIDINNNTIIITEQEETADCNCNCLFDIQIKITDLIPAIYNITINESYLHEGNEIIEFTLDIDTQTTGLICFSRNGYPWGE